MAMRKWSVIEDELKKTNPDPRLLRYLGEIHERLREQHSQIMALAEYIDKQTTLMQRMTGVFDHATDTIKKLSAKDSVVEVEGDPDEVGSTWHDLRDGSGKKQ